MRDPITGEQAYPLSRNMILALETIDGCECGAHYIDNPHTAKALVLRGMVFEVFSPEYRGRGGMYAISRRGKTALRIWRNRR